MAAAPIYTRADGDYDSMMPTPTLLTLAANVEPSFNRWVTLTVAVVLLLVILIGSFRGSKRGHQD